MRRFPSWSRALRAAVLGVILAPIAALSMATVHAATSATPGTSAVSRSSLPRTPARASAAAVECMASDDFETGTASRWTREGTWDVTSFARDGMWSLTDSPTGLYESCLTDGCGYISRSAVFSAPILLQAGSTPSLKFDHICITEHCDPPAASCDAGIVELSIDSGATWTELARYDAASYPEWNDVPVPMANAGDWKPADLDLSAFIGQTVMIRLRLESDQLLSYDGWYVDNFRVEGCLVTPTLVKAFRAVAEDAGVRLTLELATASPGARAVVYRAGSADAASRVELTAEPLAVAQRLFEYVDITLEPGRTAWYWIELRGGDGSILSGPVSATMPGASITFAAPPMPNPVVTRTTFEYTIGTDMALSGPVEMALIVHDLQGRMVRALAKGRQGAGRYHIDWDATDHRGMRVPAGVYYARFLAGNVAQTSTFSVIR